MDIKKIREALAAATPGPWTVDKCWGADRNEWHIGVPGMGTEYGPGPFATCTSLYEDERQQEANARIIASAPVWLKDLCDMVEVARSERDALRTENEQLRALLTAQPDAQWYVTECGDYDLVDSREEAERLAHERVDDYRRDAVADGEWPEDVDRVEVGYIVPVLRAVEEPGPEPGTSDWSMQPVRR